MSEILTVKWPLSSLMKTKSLRPKVLGNFRKDKVRETKIFFLGGLLEGKLISKEQVEALSKLPSKQELYAKLVGSLNAPISGFVNVLGGNLRGLVTVLKAISEKK